MNFNINLGKLFQIAGMGNDKHKIDTASEVEAVHSIFASQKSGATNPITGDTFEFSKKPVTPFSTADMVNTLVEMDPSIDRNKFDSYMQKPNSLPESFDVDRPYNVERMAQIAQMAQDIDVDKLNAYLDAAIATGADKRAEDFAIEFEANGGDDKNAQMAYTIGTLYEVGALETEEGKQ